MDIVAVLNEQSDYTKKRNYWKYLKNKLKKDNPELVSAANQLKTIVPKRDNQISIWYFRNALVRANYRNYARSIEPDFAPP